MSEISDKAAKPYPGDLIKAENFPEDCSAEYPLPWGIDNAGNGHYNFCDSKGIKFAHVYCVDAEDLGLLKEKVRKVNFAHQDKTGMMDSKAFRSKGFRRAKHPLPWKEVDCGLGFSYVFDADKEIISYIYSAEEFDYWYLELYIKRRNRFLEK